MADGDNDESLSFPIEPWEADLARKVAFRFSGDGDPDEIAAELLEHALRIKKRHKSKVKDWKAYLASSLLNRARKLLKPKKRTLGQVLSLDESFAQEPLAAGQGPLEAIEEADELDRLLKLYEELDPKMQQLWDLLLKHGGSTSEVARQLGKQKQAVDYHIQKLRRILTGRGFSS